MPLWWPFPVALAFLLSAGLTPAVIRLAERFRVVDEPKGGRKIHDRVVPLMGGISIFVGLTVPLLLVTFFSDQITAGEIDIRHILGFVLGGFVLMLGGVLDDKYSSSPKFTILFPIAAALIATLSGIGVEKLTNPLGGFVMVAPIISFGFTFFWLLGMQYTTKLLDGVDGLATTVSFVGVLLVLALSLTEKYFQSDVTMFAALAAAALFGFLLWNVYPAKIFLGEGGSTFLGFTLGILAVIAGGKVATVLLVLGIPLLDMCVVILRRFFERRPITSGDRYHLHHLLFDNGLSQHQVVMVYSGLCLLFGVTTLVFTSLQKVIALSVLSVFVILLSIALHSRKARV
jgi:UDP-GlcNAc:undecaprenyl-phosphate GlcNAc-1-phosphate transferase